MPEITLVSKVDFVDRYDVKYNAKMGARASSFRSVLREAVHQGVHTILETGSVRQPDNWAGDGQSSLIWEDYAKWCKGSFTTIDLSQEVCDVARSLLTTSTVICGDSVAEIRKDTNPIDLLYLDSFDLDMENMHPAALHCMFEFTAALPRLHPKSIVFIDDSPIHQNGSILGKGYYVAEYFKKLDVLPFVTGYQVGFLMP